MYLRTWTFFESIPAGSTLDSDNMRDWVRAYMLGL